MRHEACEYLMRQMLSAENLSTGVDTSSPHTDVFTEYPDGHSLAGIVDCSKGFDSRYEVPKSRGGRYPTLTDLKNIFSVGVSHGIRKAYGMVPTWDEKFCKAIGGYPAGVVLWDGNGNKFLSKHQNNMQPVPTDGKSNNYWKLVKPTPAFAHFVRYPSPDIHVSKGIGLNPSYMWIDTKLPLEPTTKNIMVKQFTSEDIDASIIVFTNSIDVTPRPNWVVPDHLALTNPIRPGVSSFSLKVSPYPDIYENEDHKDAYIEAYSQSSYLENIPNKTLQWGYRSPHKLIPLAPNTTYYLYMEFVNSCIEDRWDIIADYGNPIGIFFYKFSRALYWPG